MNRSVKLVLYLALFLGACFSFNRFRTAYARMEAMGPSELRQEAGQGATNSPVDTASTTNAATAGDTNAAAAAAATVVTNAVAAAETNPKSTKPGAKPSTSASAAKDPSKPFTYLGLFILALAGLGALAAWDVAQYLASRAEREMTAENFELPTSAEYEAAEEEWTKGNHLDAINLMREYLRKNPSEQHVAIRIAEIYEKDLNNYLASVLELEEVLKHKLPREKWGWTAIHLANLYSGKLNQTSKALGVLNRIVADYPDTAAAKKARQRLGIPEPEEAAPAGEEIEVQSEAPAPTPPPEPSNLPKGFRSKK
jgi:TolA-binding protein